MRTGRNQQFCNEHIEASLDHWDMRTGRNVVSDVNCFTQSLGSVENHSDMREWM